VLSKRIEPDNQADATGIAPKPPSWRDVSVLPIHPAADLFPLMNDDELAALGADIRKNGLREPITVMRQYRRRADGKFDLHEYDLVLLDGRNRLDAMERAGFSLVRDGKLDKTLGHKALGLEPFTHTGGGYAELNDGVDPYDFIISANIHRRHLTAERKRDLIAKVLKADPNKSDRQISEMVKADHKTVGGVRAQQEATGEISPVEKRVGKDRKTRKRPTKQPKRATDPPPPVSDEVSRDDVGPSSASELERLCARNEELENKVRCLEIENLALRSEVDELKAELAKRPPPADDGLDIPASLRRAAP
jgi:hypothetical protein